MNKMLIASFWIFSSSVFASTAVFDVFTTDTHKNLGTVTLKDGPYGMIIKPDLKDLSPGAHGLHIHQFPSCENKGMKAGGHFDPDNTKTHKGPYEPGHKGDLPVLFVGGEGKANTISLAPRLKVDDVKGLSLMVHGGGDNYSDKPKLGGGGSRIACGVLKKAD